jgi:hypothetical protein
MYIIVKDSKTITLVPFTPIYIWVEKIKAKNKVSEDH